MKRKSRPTESIFICTVCVRDIFVRALHLFNKQINTLFHAMVSQLCFTFTDLFVSPLKYQTSLLNVNNIRASIDVLSDLTVCNQCY